MKDLEAHIQRRRFLDETETVSSYDAYDVLNVSERLNSILRRRVN